MGEVNTVLKQEIYKIPAEGYLYVERHCHDNDCATRSDVLISTVSKKEASECMDLHEEDAKPFPSWPNNEICIAVEEMQESIYIMLEKAFEDIPEEVSKDYLIGKIQKAVEQNLKKQMEGR